MHTLENFNDKTVKQPLYLLKYQNITGKCLITISNWNEYMVLRCTFLCTKLTGTSPLTGTEHRHKRILRGFLHTICTM